MISVRWMRVNYHSSDPTPFSDWHRTENYSTTLCGRTIPQARDESHAQVTSCQICRQAEARRESEAFKAMPSSKSEQLVHSQPLRILPELRIREAVNRERDLCKRDACPHCGGRTAYVQVAEKGPEGSGNYIHRPPQGCAPAIEAVLCKASAIYGREEFEKRKARAAGGVAMVLPEMLQKADEGNGRLPTVENVLAELCQAGIFGGPFGQAYWLRQIEVARIALAEAQAEEERRKVILRDERRIIREWQKFAERLGRLLGCIAITDNIEEAVREKCQTGHAARVVKEMILNAAPGTDVTFALEIQQRLGQGE